VVRSSGREILYIKVDSGRTQLESHGQTTSVFGVSVKLFLVFHVRHFKTILANNNSKPTTPTTADRGTMSSIASDSSDEPIMVCFPIIPTHLLWCVLYQAAASASSNQDNAEDATDQKQMVDLTRSDDEEVQSVEEAKKNAEETASYLAESLIAAMIEAKLSEFISEELNVLNYTRQELKAIKLAYIKTLNEELTRGINEIYDRIKMFE
jgi:hypothetical protein